MPAMIDLFVSHDWRDHKDRDRVLDTLDKALGLFWRNYGSPWYDPAIQLGSPEGIAQVREFLEGQVIPAKVVIFIPTIYTGSKRGQQWVGFALEFAKKHNVPVLGVSDTNGPPADEKVAALADRWIGYDGPSLLAAVNEMTGKK
jgi:hypothetical protein